MTRTNLASLLGRLGAIGDRRRWTFADYTTRLFLIVVLLATLLAAVILNGQSA
jgi:hypothetical protein